MSTVDTLAPFNYASNLFESFQSNKLSAKDLFEQWFNLNKEIVEKLYHIYLKFIHVTLLIDDIQDGTLARSGRPTANAIYGVPLAVNAGVLVFSELMEEVASLRDDKVLNVFLEEWKNVYKGQGIQLQWNKDKTCPTMNDAIEMCTLKGCMYTLWGRLACASMKYDENKYLNVFKMMNLAMQIDNDISGCADLRDIKEGQYNFVTIFSILREKQIKNNSSRLQDILNSTEKTNEMLNEARDIMCQTNAFEYAYFFLNNLCSEIKKEVNAIGGNSKFESFIEKFSIDTLRGWPSGSKDASLLGNNLAGWPNGSKDGTDSALGDNLAGWPSGSKDVSLGNNLAGWPNGSKDGTAGPLGDNLAGWPNGSKDTSLLGNNLAGWPNGSKDGTAGPLGDNLAGWPNGSKDVSLGNNLAGWPNGSKDASLLGDNLAGWPSGFKDASLLGNNLAGWPSASKNNDDGTLGNN